MSNYYVYVLLDPRKPGRYSYRGQHFDFKPFYVGMGKNSRDISHIKESLNFYSYSKEKRKRFNKYKICIIRLLIKIGLDTIILRVREGISREEAICLEIDMISHWGRKNDGSGFLSNMTEGGENFSNTNIEGLKYNLSQWWKLISPEGKEFYVKGLSEVCQKYGLNPSKLSSVADGKNYRHKGWNSYKIVDGKVVIKDKELVPKEIRYGKEFSETMGKALKGKKFSEEHKKSLRKPKGTLTKTEAFMKSRKITGEKRKGKKVESITRNWEFISPDGKIYNVRGMKYLCDKMELIPACISAAVKKKTKYKGWQIKELPSNFFENNEISKF